MKPSELRERSVADLKKEILILLKAQFGLRMQHATQQLSNPNQLNNIRKDIARVKTILTQKEQQL